MSRRKREGTRGRKRADCNDVAHLKLDPASRRGARPASHRDRSVGGRVYSEKGSARERGEEQQIGWQVLIGALHLARRTN